MSRAFLSSPHRLSPLLFFPFSFLLFPDSLFLYSLFSLLASPSSFFVFLISFPDIHIFHILSCLSNHFLSINSSTPLIFSSLLVLSVHFLHPNVSCPFVSSACCHLSWAQAYMRRHLTRFLSVYIEEHRGTGGQFWGGCTPIDADMRLAFRGTATKSEITICSLTIAFSTRRLLFFICWQVEVWLAGAGDWDYRSWKPIFILVMNNLLSLKLKLPSPTRYSRMGNGTTESYRMLGSPSLAGMLVLQHRVQIYLHSQVSFHDLVNLLYLAKGDLHNYLQDHVVECSCTAWRLMLHDAILSDFT